MAIKTSGEPSKPKWTPPSALSSAEVPNMAWWELKGYEAAQSVSKNIETIRINQSARIRQLLLSTMLYSGRPQFNIYGQTNQMRLVRSAQVPLGRVTFNVIQSACDSLVSKITSDESVPYYLTQGGTFKQQRQAKALTSFSDGILYEAEAQDILGPMCFRDSFVMGDGVAYGYVDSATRRVKFERAPTPEHYVDELEGQYGRPRSWHRVRTVDKRVLLRQFRGKDKATALIKAVQDVTLDGVGGAGVIQVSNVVDVRESWHLPSGEDAGDGCYKVTLDNGELWSEEWTEDWFPFVKIGWSAPIAGFWSMSAASQIQGIQMELNKLLWLQSRAIHLAGAFKCFIPADSRIVQEHMNNMVGMATYFTGSSPPVYITVPAVSEQIIARIGTLKSDAFEQVGANEMLAASKDPLGPDASGAARREFATISSERFYDVGRKYQQFFVDLSRLGIRLAKKVADEDGSYEVTYKRRGAGRTYLEKLDWKDVDIDEDQFTTKCWSVALLPDTPAGQQQSIAEQVQAGWLTPRQGQRLMAYPDLAAAEQLDTSAEDYLHKILDKMVDGDGSTDEEAPDSDYTAPSPEDDLQLAAELVGQYLNEARVNDLPDERINLLRTFAQQIQTLVTAATPPQPSLPPGAAQAALPPGGSSTPQATPATAPVSDLVPQAA
jgi:hypothetical protein